jgi:RimJ/RimL family protein N-acetyltransferase
MDNVLFHTSRLIVRRLVANDIPALMEVYGDADAMRWVGDGQPITLAQCEKWITVTDNNYAKRGYGMTALCASDGGEIIGFCGLVHPDNQVETEIKYALKRSHWGRGFATEAVRGMLAYARDAFAIQQVIATTAPANAASHNVLLKSGMARSDLKFYEDGSSTQVFIWRAAESPQI